MSNVVAVPSWIKLPLTSDEQQKAARDLLNAAEDHEIDSPEGRAIADQDLLRIKRLKAEVESAKKGITGPIDAAKKAVLDFFRPAASFLDEAESITSRKILTYDRRIAEERSAEQRRLDEAARAERQRLIDEAKALESSGNAAAAQAVAEAAVLVQAPVLSLGPDKAATSTDKRVTWSSAVDDLLALARAVVEGKVPPEAILPNMTYLNGRARLEKGKLSIPGVRAVDTESLAAKRSS